VRRRGLQYDLLGINIDAGICCVRRPLRTTKRIGIGGFRTTNCFDCLTIESEMNAADEANANAGCVATERPLLRQPRQTHALEQRAIASEMPWVAVLTAASAVASSSALALLAWL